MNIFTRQISFFKRVSIVDKLLFTRHLAMMLKSGIPISEAMYINYQQTSSQYFKTVLAGMEKDIKNGQTLYKSAIKYPKVFDQVYLNLIRIGEQSGKLEDNLTYLAVQQRKNYEFQKKIQGALMYPGLILATAAVVGAGISFFVMPKLVDLFESMDVELPLATKILLFIANITKTYNILLLIAAITIVILFRFIITRPSIKPYWHFFLLSIPKVGNFLQNIELAMICRNLGIMMQSGLLITSALEILLDSTSNSIYKDILKKILYQIDKGRSVEDSLERIHSKFIPLIMIKMIGVGEKSGKMDESLIYLGEFFEEEVDNTAKNLSTILEPVILIGIGLVVAFIALAIISPIYQLTGSISK